MDRCEEEILAEKEEEIREMKLQQLQGTLLHETYQNILDSINFSNIIF